MNKIKYYILIAISLLTISNLYSQSFKGGVLAGPVTSQVNGDGYGGYHQLGYTAGFFTNWPTENKSSWQLELKYSLFGAHSDVKELEWALPYNLRLHYIELPIMYRHDLSGVNVNGRNLDFVGFELGISPDFLIRNLQAAGDEYGFENGRWLFLSFTGNIGLYFNLNEHWSIDVRSMNSITPCRWRGDSPSIFYGHYYNIALQAAIYFTL